MIKNILGFIFFVMPVALLAQCPKDSNNLADPFHYCGDFYQPVCGCDDVTYRSPCAAQYWGGIIDPLLGVNIFEGPCGSFDFDFVPNPVGGFSSGNSGSHLHIAFNQTLFATSTTVSYSVYLLDIFNKVMYQRDATANPLDNIQGSGADNGIAIGDFSSDYFSRFQNGVYLLIVTVNGEQKTKKIVIENPK
jgi:hypothetical protein